MLGTLFLGGMIGGMGSGGAGEASPITQFMGYPTKAQTEQLYEQQTIFGEQQGFEKQLAKLIQDPSSVTTSPGYQFGLSQGLQGVERQYGAMGLNKSGGAGSALFNYGQNYAMNSWMQQIQMLAGLSGITGGAGSTAGLGGNVTTAQSNTYGSTMHFLGNLFG